MNKLTFDEVNHIYRYEGNIVPSVTQILRQAGLIDFSKVNPAVLEASMKFGTAVHLACEYHDKGILDENKLDVNLKPYLYAWMKFKKDFNIKIEAAEEFVYSPKYEYAGKLDRRVIIRKRAVLDIKTSEEIYPANAIQLMGYLEAYNEGKKIQDKIQQRFIVMLSNDANYKLEEFTKLSDRVVWYSAVNIAKFRKENQLWKQ